MEDNTVMIEAVFDREYAEVIFAAFQHESKALESVLYADDSSEKAKIVCGFKNENLRQVTVGKIERMFPGKIDWR